MGSNLSLGGDTAELTLEIERLKSRIALLEAERDEYAQQNSELFVLQQVFSTINSTLDINDILSMVLRGVVEALKFKRVILFDVLPDSQIVRRLECDALGQVSHTVDPRDYRAGSTLYDVAHGDLQLAYGSAGDSDKPLEDTRGSYCLAPLVARDIVRGLLYADDPPAEDITENQLRVLLDFSSQAAVAVENARLYEETRRLLEETQRLALTDSLTGLNRRALNGCWSANSIPRALRHRSPSDPGPDDLKRQRLGRPQPRRLALKRFAQVLKKNARKGDIIARYAGDESCQDGPERPPADRAWSRASCALRRNGLTSSIRVAMFRPTGPTARPCFRGRRSPIKPNRAAESIPLLPRKAATETAPRAKDLGSGDGFAGIV